MIRILLQAVLAIDGSGKARIFNSSDTAAYANMTSYLESGPLLVHMGAVQPLEAKKWNEVLRVC